MSIVVAPGALITVTETDLMCPICTGPFDASKNMDRAKHPVFNMRCPNCNGWLRIVIPVFGGTTTVFERASSPNVPPARYKAPFTVNGKRLTPPR